MKPEISARLNELQIQLMAETPQFCMFVRETCVAMAPRSTDLAGFLSIGSTGLFLEQGLAYLFWREEQPLLVGHGFTVPADPAQVEQVQRFSADLKSALALT